MSTLMVFTRTDIETFLGRQAFEELAARKARVCEPKQLDAAAALVEEGVFDAERWIKADAVQVLLAWACSHGRTITSLKHFMADNREVAERMSSGATDSDDAASERVAQTFRTGGVVNSYGKPRRQRKPITDPDVLEKRQQALTKARAARAERLAEAREAAAATLAEQLAAVSG